MKPTFNLLDRGWIPVVCEDGTRKLLGIRQTLAQAHELREISDPSPLDEYSLYRFLGLFLMDALRPEETEDIEDLLEAGRFDMKRIEAYIAQCQSEGVSFDLFDEKRPFLQSWKRTGDRSLWNTRKVRNLRTKSSAARKKIMQECRSKWRSTITEAAIRM